MRWRILALCGLVGTGVACAVGGEDAHWQTDTSEGALVVEQATPERVRGSFRRDGATISFDASRSRDGARALTLVASDGTVLLRATSTGPSGGLVDEKALERIFASPDAIALPWLSRELGRRGMGARGYPATFELHGLALVVGKAGAVSLPPLPPGEGEQATDTAAPAPRAKSQCAYEPQGDACFGMCGAGCNCWRWVCGDCCWHGGCAAHDDDCRSCSFTHPGACARCASFVGFFTGGGCDD